MAYIHIHNLNWIKLPIGRLNGFIWRRHLYTCIHVSTFACDDLQITCQVHCHLFSLDFFFVCWISTFFLFNYCWQWDRLCSNACQNYWTKIVNQKMFVFLIFIITQPLHEWNHRQRNQLSWMSIASMKQSFWFFKKKVEEREKELYSLDWHWTQDGNFEVNSYVVSTSL